MAFRGLDGEIFIGDGSELEAISIVVLFLELFLFLLLPEYHEVALGVLFKQRSLKFHKILLVVFFEVVLIREEDELGDDGLAQIDTLFLRFLHLVVIDRDHQGWLE